MIEPRVIKTEEQHLEYLREVERMIILGSKLSRIDTARLEVLTVLIESYENRRYPIEPLDPIEAIQFRMHEKGLKQADLVPYLGTSGRVSEVMSRKRPLTVQMIRALSIGLGISADTLIGLEREEKTGEDTIDWKKFPMKEIVERGWLSVIDKVSLKYPERLIEEYLSSSGIRLESTSFRRSLSGDAITPTTTYAIYAWIARVIQKSREQRGSLGVFERDRMSTAFLKELAHLSWFDTGPSLAVEFLRRNGISVVVEPQLKGTQLDGAALRDVDGRPIVALTLRFDRLDSFWFTLLHEVAHVWKHLDDDREAFVDDLHRTSDDRREAEANRIAAESFIPRLVWKRSDAYLNPNTQTIESLARDLKIHPSVIAGRLRRERGNFSAFADLVGQNAVRKLLAQSEL